MRPLSPAISFLFVLVLTLTARAADYDALARGLKGLTPLEIKEEGNRYARAEQWDKAIYCYQTVISQYGPNAKEFDELAATAYNNLGYVYFYGRADYSQAFQSYLHSQEIAQDVGDEEMMPYVDLNLANVYSIYQDTPNMMLHYRKAFDGATRLGVHEVAVTAICSLVVQAMADGKPSEIRAELAQFGNARLPASTPGLRYARTLCQAAAKLDQGEADQALRLLSQASDIDPDMLTPDRFKGQNILMRANILRRQGRTGEAIAELRAVPPSQLPDDIRVAFLEAESQLLEATGHPDSALMAHATALRISDSLLRTQGYGMIRDLRSDWEARRAAQQVQDADHRRAQAWIWASVALAVALALGALAIVIVAKNRQLRQSNQALFQRANEASEQYERMRRQLEDRAESGERTAERGEIDAALLAKITAAMADPAVITDDELNMDRLAKAVGSNTSYVSRAINNGLGKNFAALLGEARVRLAQQRLTDPALANLTIEGIAADLGFKSRTNFIAVFKRVTGLTPTQFKKLAARGNEE